jgi:hypothetical protein
VKETAGNKHRRQWPGKSPSLRKVETFEPAGPGWKPACGPHPAAAGLKALETGMEGGKWFRLIDKVWWEKNLQSALEQVLCKGGSAGIDGRSASVSWTAKGRRNRHPSQTPKSRER